MKFKTLAIIKAVVCLGFGPLLLLVPAWLLEIFGATYCSGSALTAREYGAALVGTVFLTWIGRDSERSRTRTAIIWHLFIYDAIALVATLWIILSGEINALGWGIVFIYLFFSAGFGSLLLKRQETGAEA